MTDHACRFVGKDQPRMLRTHTPDCADPACPGCQPCPDRHCRLCYREHVTVDGRGTDQTCGTCIGQIRTLITGIVGFSTRMLGEAIIRGINSEAAHLEGPAADPAAWQQRGTYGHRYDPDSRLSENHPLWVLGSWDMRVARLYGHTRGRVTITDAADYLRLHLTRLAHDPDFDLESFNEAVKDCHTHMEQVLRDGEQVDTGAPCMECRVPLRHVYGGDDLPWSSKEHPARARNDGWACPRCRRWHSEDQYRFAVMHDHQQNADELPLKDLAERIGVEYTRVRHWASPTRHVTRDRGVWHDDPKIKPTRMLNGRKVYRVSDAIAVRDQLDESSA